MHLFDCLSFSHLTTWRGRSLRAATRGPSSYTQVTPFTSCLSPSIAASMFAVGGEVSGSWFLSSGGNIVAFFIVLLLLTIFLTAQCSDCKRSASSTRDAVNAASGRNGRVDKTWFVVSQVLVQAAGPGRGQQDVEPRQGGKTPTHTSSRHVFSPRHEPR